VDESRQISVFVVCVAVKLPDRTVVC